MPARKTEPARDLLHLIPTLRFLARSYRPGKEAADALVHETLLAALAGPCAALPPSDLPSGLFAVMRRLAGTEEITPGGPPADWPDAVRRLPLSFREALILTFLLDGDEAEAAKICGCSPQAVAVLAEEARHLLLTEAPAPQLPPGLIKAQTGGGRRSRQAPMPRPMPSRRNPAATPAGGSTRCQPGESTRGRMP